MGNDGSGNRLWWLMQNGWPVVASEARGDDWERYDGAVTMLVDLVTGRLESESSSRSRTSAMASGRTSTGDGVSRRGLSGRIVPGVPSPACRVLGPIADGFTIREDNAGLPAWSFWGQVATLWIWGISLTIATTAYWWQARRSNHLHADGRRNAVTA